MAVEVVFFQHRFQSRLCHLWYILKESKAIKTICIYKSLSNRDYGKVKGCNILMRSNNESKYNYDKKIGLYRIPTAANPPLYKNI